MKLVIVKYNSGNVSSVAAAFRRLGVDTVLSDDADVLRSADKIVFPGVGEAGSAMNYLKANGLDKLLPSLKQPVLGICLGMQLMCDYSEEGSTKCLGIFDLPVKRFQPSMGTAEPIKVPQMGWNTLTQLSSPLFAGIGEEAFQYFVHSYFVPSSSYTIATTHYGIDYSAAIHRNNFYAVQFHPEKSAEVGAKVLQNFLGINQ